MEKVFLIKAYWCSLFLFVMQIIAPQEVHPPTTYIVERLAHHVKFLQKINTTFKQPTIKVDPLQPLCKHELTRWCIQKIREEQRLDVVFDVWGAFTAHTADTCTDDCIFVHDFAALIYVIYMNIVTLAARVQFQDFLTLYAQVSELPIEELLNLLDIFYERLGIIFQAYSETASYTHFAKEYWWIPGAVLAAVATKIVHWYLNRITQRVS